MDFFRSLACEMDLLGNSTDTRLEQETPLTDAAGFSLVLKFLQFKNTNMILE